MNRKMQTLDELMAEDDAKREAQTKAEIAAEDAAYHALPQAEKDRIQAERDAYWARLAAAEEAAPDNDEDEDEDHDESEQ